MAYDKSTGVLTIDSANETFDVILDNTARALNDYRVTEVAGVFARDVGLLCTSPNVNRNSVRRPIYTPIDKLGMETEAYLQSQMYGFKDLFNNSKNYTKLGYGTTQSWFDKIAAKGAGADLWGDSLPNGGYYVINQFNKYYNKATSRKEYINNVKPLEETALSAGSDFYTIPYGDFVTELDPDGLYTGVSAIGTGLHIGKVFYCTYTINIEISESTDYINFGGRVDMYDEGKLAARRYFVIAQPEPGISYDLYGNKIEYNNDNGIINCYIYISWDATEFSGEEGVDHGINEELFIEFNHSTKNSTEMPINATLYGNVFTYKGKSTIVDNSKIPTGLYFSDVPKSLSFDKYSNSAVGTYKSPHDFILSSIDNNNTTAYKAGTKLFAILKFYFYDGSIRHFIINPYHITKDPENNNTEIWGGVVKYEQLGLYLSEVSSITSVYCLLFYANYNDSINYMLRDHGFVEDITVFDKYNLIPERFGYAQVMQAQ